MPRQLMSQVEFAKHRGVGKSAVSNWKRDDLLIFAEDDRGRLKVDVVRSDAKLNAKLDPLRGRPATAAPSAPGGEEPALPLDAAAPGQPAAIAGSLNDERQLHLREQRIGQAMKNAATAGELVPLIEAQRRVSEVGRAARERMHAWARSIAERVAAEKDVRQVMAIFEGGIDQVFTELADAAAAGEFAGGDDEDLTDGERAELEAAESGE